MVNIISGLNFRPAYSDRESVRTLTVDAQPSLYRHRNARGKSFDLR
jgi:hypothetical protein